MTTNYFIVPKKFFYDETFQQLTANARLLFLYYWNEFLFPAAQLEVDEDGNPLITDEWAHAQLFLGITPQTAKKARRELHRAGYVKPAIDKNGEFTKLRILAPVRTYSKEVPKPIQEGSPPPMPKPRPQPYPIIDEP